MTSTHTTTQTPQPRLTLAAPPTAAVGLALALVIIFASNYHVGKDESGGTGPALVTAIGCLVLTAVLFGVVLPRTRRGTKTAMILGAVAIATIAIFWSGATPVLAAASFAATAGASSTRRGTRTVQVLAGVVTAAAVAITLAQSHLF
jgi:hypothetical protein